MRDSLTILAIALIVVLTGALAGPYFVDWSAERGWIEARLSGALGARTRIRGPIDLKLLPTPYFVVEDIEIAASGDPAAAWDVSIKKMRLEIAAAALFHGEVDFVEAKLESPRLTLRLSDDGALPLTPPEATLAHQFRFERVAIANGALRIDDRNKRSLDLDGIDIDAEAASLSGPFKGKGAFGAAHMRTTFRFATGPMEKGELNLKFLADGGNAQPRVELDGRLNLRPGAQRFAGAAKLESAQPPWRATGQLTCDTRKAMLDRIELRLGSPAHVLSANGQADFDFSAAPRASATFASDEIDLDRWRFGDGSGAIQDLIPPAFPSLPFTLAYGARTLILGGAAFTDVSASLAFGGRRPAPASFGEADAASQEKNAAEKSSYGEPPSWLRFEARGPGKSRLSLDGQWRRGASPGFEGKVQADAADARWLQAWLAPIAPQWTPAALPFHAIELAAVANFSPAAIELRDLAARIDGAQISGTLGYRQAAGSAPSRLDADLAAPSLDLDAIARLDPGFLARTLSLTDGSLRLDAAALTLGKADSIGGGAVDLVKTGEKIELNQLTFEGVDGTVITAGGLLSQKKAHIDAKFLARDGKTLAALLAKFASDPVATFVRSRAGPLGPIDFSLAADAAERNAVFAMSALAAKGSIGGAAIEASVRDDAPQTGNVTISAVLRSRDSLPLIHLFGLHPTPETGLGPAHIEITAQGPPGEKAQTSITASIGPASLSFKGAVVTALSQPSAKGALRFSSPDAAPLLRTIGLAFPDFAAKSPVAGVGDLTWTKSETALTNLKADVAGTAVVGDLAFGPQQRLAGSIEIDRMSGATLFGLVLGPPEPAKAGSLWSSLAFAPAAFDLPNARVALTIRDVALPEAIFPGGVAAKNACATLETGPGRLDLRDFSLDLDGGRIAGEIRIRRAAQDASIESRLEFAHLALNGSTLRGSLSGGLDASATGKTADSLAASLAGSGRAVISGLTVPRADPAALSRVFLAFDRDGHKLAARDIAAALASELKHADFKAESRAFDLSLAAGMLHLSEAAGSMKADASLSATLDLRRAMLSQQLTFVLTPTPKDFSGPAPHIALLFQGPFSSPALQIDAASLANTLAARAIQRDSARIEAYEFDIHERAFFYQRLLSERRRDSERAAAAGIALQKTEKAAD